MTKSPGSDQLRILASFMGISGVGLGAVGAHALQNRLAQRGMHESWKTAVLYHLFHSAAVLGVSALAQNQTEGSSEPSSNSSLVRSGQLMGIGTLMFSGSIYLLCLGIGPRKVLGPITPLGGLLMMGGWGMLLLQ